MSIETEIIAFLKLGERFAEEISDESNRQILFTGPFGSGKTTFLRTFFKELSQIPLALLKYNEINNIDHKSIDSNLDDSISILNKKLHLEIIKDNNSRRVYCTLAEIDANETNVILLSLHAIQSLENWINYSR